MNTLGGSAWIFHEPVDAKVVVDYYQIIKQPMCFKQVKEKLRRRAYSSPEAFYSVSQTRRRRWRPRCAHAVLCCAVLGSSAGQPEPAIAQWQGRAG